MFSDSSELYDDEIVQPEINDEQQESIKSNERIKKLNFYNIPSNKNNFFSISKIETFFVLTILLFIDAFTNHLYKQNINHLYNRLYLNNFLQQLRQNPLKPNKRRIFKNPDYYDYNNEENNELKNEGDDKKLNTLRANEHNRHQRRKNYKEIDYDQDYATTIKMTTKTTTLPTLNVNVHLKDKKNGQKFNGMNVNVNLLNNKNKTSDSTLAELETLYSDEELIKSLSNVMNKNIKLTENKEILIPRNSRPDAIMDSIPLSTLGENLESILLPLAAYFYESGNAYHSPSSSSGDDKRYDESYKNDRDINDKKYRTTTVTYDNKPPFSRLIVSTATNIIETVRTRATTTATTTPTVPVLPDGVLTIISNNNNNININEDKLSYDELLDLVRRNNNQLTKKQLLTYDQNRNRPILPNQPLLYDQPFKMLSIFNNFRINIIK